MTTIHDRPGIQLDRARAALREAAASESSDERFAQAQLAALRVAAAVVAQRGRPIAARRRLVNVWDLLDRVAPEYHDWSGYFAAAGPVRAAIDAGAWHAVQQRTADDHVRAAGQFLELVQSRLGRLPVRLAG